MGVFLGLLFILFCDNKSVIQIAHNHVFHEANKAYRNSLTHLGHFVRHHFLQGFNAIHFLRASDRGSSYEVPHHYAIPILSIQTPDVIP